MNYLLAIAIALAAIGGMFALVGWAHGWFTYRVDERNPYRRYCRTCGQQQDMYCMDYSDGPSRGWWENMSPLNESCPVGHRAEDKL